MHRQSDIQDKTHDHPTGHLAKIINSEECNVNWIMLARSYLNSHTILKPSLSGLLGISKSAVWVNIR